MSAFYGYNNYFSSHSAGLDADVNSSNVSLDTSAFTGNVLTPYDVDVQKAMETLNTYLDDNTSFIMYTNPGLDKYPQIKLGANSNIDATTESALIIGAGTIPAVGPSITSAAYSSICIGNGTMLEVGPSATTPYSIVIGTLASSTGPGGVAIGFEAKAHIGCLAIGDRAAVQNSAGAGNTALGHSAMTRILNTDHNTAIGYRSMESAIGCIGCVSIGYWAGTFNDSCEYNVAIGEEAMRGNGTNPSTGHYNVGIGYKALECNSALTAFTGSYNVGVGMYSLNALTTGAYNVGLGYQTGVLIKTGQYNVCIGRFAGDTLTTGSNNICIGNDSDTIAAGVSNIAIGITALATGSSNSIAIGYTSTASSIYSIAIGNGSTASTNSDALAIGRSSTSTGLYTVAIGVAASATGSSSTALGIYANTQGSGAVAIGGGIASTSGARALANYSIAIGGAGVAYEGAIANGSNSVCIGELCRTSGITNVMIGYKNGGGVTGGVPDSTGAGNISIGYSNTPALSTGSNNVVLGYETATVLNSGLSNVCIGYQVAVALTTGASNVCIASYSGASITTGSWNICIGRSADCAATINYQISLGHTATCSGADSCAIGRNASSGANQFTIGPNMTDCRYYDASGWTNLSDEREKKNIRKCSESCIEFIKALEVKEFEMSKSPGRKHIGFIAQDIHKLLNDNEKTNMKIVQYDEKEDRYYLAVQPIFMKHISATQELIRRIEVLEERLSAVK